MTLLLKAPHVLLEDMGLILSTDMMGSQLFIYYFNSRESNAFFRCLPQVHEHSAKIYMQEKHPNL